MSEETEDDFIYNDVTGQKKSILTTLSKTKVSKHEMDDIFLSEDEI